MITVIAFAAVMAVSLGLALLSRRGGAQSARDFFVASGQLGALLIFFLSVGETYSVASMLGFPGGVYAHGDGFSAWFFGYILLVAPALFFVGPWIARAGAHYQAATIADFFGRHYESRALEIAISIASIAVLVPVGTMQFLGLKIVLASLAPDAPPLLLIGGAGVLAFAYVAVAGLRTSAYVAVFKDLLMIGSILLVAGVALASWRVGQVPSAAAPAAPIAAKDLTFAVSTILVQSIGYAMLPQTWAFLFAAKSGEAIRRSQMAAPLYMVMFPLLMIVATYALTHGLNPPKPDFVFLTTAEALLPGWAFGVVLGGVTLAGLVVLAAVCLAIGSIATRNLVSGLDGAAQRKGAIVVTALYVILSIAFAEGPAKLMATMNNLIYFGIIQTLPALVAAFRLPRVSAVALIGGIVAGDAVAMAIFGFGVDVGGVNAGLIGLVPNLVVTAVLTVVWPRAGETVLEKLRAA